MGQIDTFMEKRMKLGTRDNKSNVVNQFCGEEGNESFNFLIGHGDLHSLKEIFH